MLSTNDEKNREREQRIISEIESADSSPLLQYLGAASQPFWWRSDGDTQVALSLSTQQHALLDRFLELSGSSKVQPAIDYWKGSAREYLRQSRNTRTADGVVQAYESAETARILLIEVLWEAVENARP